MKSLEKKLEPADVTAFHKNVTMFTALVRRNLISQAHVVLERIIAPLHPDPPLSQRTTQQALCMYHISPVVPTVEGCTKIAGKLHGLRVLEINAHRGVWGTYLQSLGMSLDMIHRAKKQYATCIGAVMGTESPPSYVQGAKGRYDALLMVKPDTQDGMGDALACAQAFSGDWIVYVGMEPPEAMSDVEKEGHVWTFLEKHYVFVDWCACPTWPYTNDHIMFYRKKANVPVPLTPSEHK